MAPAERMAGPAPAGSSHRALGRCAERVVQRIDPREVPERTYVGLEHIGAGTLHLRDTGRCRDVNGPCLLAEEGDIVFGKLRPYFRKVIRAPHRLACTSEAWVVRAAAGVDPRYLFYAMADPAFVDACSAASKGTRMPRADWGFARDLPLWMPPLAEQRRIAAALGALDDKIALNRAMNRTLAETTRTLFRRWFLEFRGQRRRVDSAIGPVPAGWEVAGIDRVVRQVRDTADPTTLAPETPYVGLGHLPRRAVALESWGRASEVSSTKRRFSRGDTLFGRLRPYFHKVVPAPVSGVCSTDILVLRPRHEAWRWFAFGHLFSDALVAHTAAAADGTRMPRTSWKDLCRFPLAIPPRAVAAAYDPLVDPMYDRITRNVHESRTLAHLRDTLLPGLVSGTTRLTADS